MAVDAFFCTRIKVYHEMRVPQSGNDKSMLAMALATDQLKKPRVVVFVSASALDEYEGFEIITALAWHLK
jgi:hypothetical protein